MTGGLRRAAARSLPQWAMSERMLNGPAAYVHGIWSLLSLRLQLFKDGCVLPTCRAALRTLRSLVDG
jgi:hypothetical protein